MVDAAAFRALRYDPRLAGDPLSTSAPAYDELTPFTYARHRTASPYTVLELMAGDHETEEDAYGAAAAAYDRWCRTGVLRLDEQPSFYRYEQHWLRHGAPTVQRGLLAAVRLGDDTVMTHEHVDPERVRERLRRLEAVPLDLSPVYALYARTSEALGSLLHTPPTHPPIAAMTDEEGVDHRIWQLSDPGTVAAITTALEPVQAVIADGHHRYATANALLERRGHADAAHERTLMLLVDTTTAGPEVRGIHRLVRTVDPRRVAGLRDAFVITQAPAHPGELLEALEATDGPAIGLLLAGQAAQRAGLSRADTPVTGSILTPGRSGGLAGRLPAGHSLAWYGLDATVFEHVVLPQLEIRPATVAHRVDLGGAAAEVAAGAAEALFVLRPVKPETVFEVAAAGDTMPPKTTWFFPKPRTGLVLRPLRTPPVESANP